MARRLSLTASRQSGPADRPVHVATWKTHIGVHQAALSRLFAKKVAPHLPEWLGHPILAIVRVLDSIANAEEPKRSGPLARLVHSPCFEFVCVLIIFCNVFFTVAAVSSDLQGIRDGQAEDSQWALIVETIFLCFYSVELIVRLAVHGKYYFINEDANWNIFDVTLVILTSVDVVTSWSTLNQSASKSHARMLRLLKFGRIARALKAVKFFEQLRLMLELCMMSLYCVFWAMVMIAIVLFMASLFFVEGVVTHLRSGDNPAEALEELHQFDGLTPTALTCLQSATGGIDWIEPYETLAALGPLYQGMFVLYVLFFILILLNIVTSVFLDRVMKFAEPSVESIVEDKTWMEEKDLKQLEHIMRKADVDGSGTINVKEFKGLVSSHHFGALLAARGIDINEAAMFLDIIAENSSRQDIDIKDMVRSCLRMKGTATNVDLQILRHEIKVQHKQLAHALRGLSSPQQSGTS